MPAAAPASPILPLDVEKYLKLFGVRVKEILGDGLVGCYLHGSGALGGYSPVRSDIDLLVVVQNALTENQRTRVCEDIGSASVAIPASMLEMSVVTAEACQHPVAAPPYELHVNSRDDRCVDGTGRTDPDLVLHFAVTRQSGRLISLGLPPRDVFAPVPQNLILEGMALELEGALRSPKAAPEYIVLNACRNLAYESTGHIYSKIDGAEWVLEHVPAIDRRLIIAALHRQEGGSDESIDQGSAATFAAGIANTLRRREG